MYEKLGDMLSSVLETGVMPPGAPKKRGPRPRRKTPPMPAYLAGDFAALGFADAGQSPTKTECAKAYRALVKARHPDTKAAPNPGGVNPDSAVAEIIKAYKRVSAWYDSLSG
jgi:hypothetical protein